MRAFSNGVLSRWVMNSEVRRAEVAIIGGAGSGGIGGCLLVWASDIERGGGLCIGYSFLVRVTLNIQLAMKFQLKCIRLTYSTSPSRSNADNSLIY
jgi:hypothetical protein